MHANALQGSVSQSLLLDKAQLTSYSTLAVVVEAWLACSTAFSAVVTSLRTRLSCNPYFLPQCLGLLALHHLVEVENNNRAKTACRIFHQGTPNMSVLVQTGIPVGF